ncbi:MAG: hypothetical protein MZW92_23565 [Comamonadaceae bacterium]|nr:hypothetical protein [Comamonadaceae bacterium]
MAGGRRSRPGARSRGAPAQIDAARRATAGRCSAWPPRRASCAASPRGAADAGRSGAEGRQRRAWATRAACRCRATAPCSRSTASRAEALRDWLAEARRGRARPVEAS